MNMDLQDTTFIIPVRIDSVARLENLIATVASILSCCQTEIRILEAAPYANGLIPRLIQSDQVSYLFRCDKDPVFHKTRWLNEMAREVTTPYICVWDADVLIAPMQIEEAMRALRTDTCDIAYPYDGDFLDTSDILRAHYLVHQDLSYLLRHSGKMNSLYTVEGVIGAVGGAFFAKTEKYKAAGMENEDFYGWGLEDGERHYRWLEFGYRIYRASGCMFHLSHPRDLNGGFRSKAHGEKAVHDMNRVVDYSRQELKKIIEIEQRSFSACISINN